MTRFSLTRFLLSKFLLGLIALCLLPCLFMGSAGAQATYNPGSPTIAAVPGLQTALTNTRTGSGGLISIIRSGADININGLSDGTHTSLCVNRSYVITRDSTEPRVVFGNLTYGDLPGPNALTIKCTFGVNVIQGVPGGYLNTFSFPRVWYPMTFSGASSITLAPGKIAVSDPLPLELPVGTLIYVLFQYVVPAGGKYPSQTQALAGEGVNYSTDITGTQTNGTDCTGITADGTFLPAPMGVIGRSSGFSVMLVGDSIMRGVADTQGGWAARAFNADGTINFWQQSVGGERLSGLAAATTYNETTRQQIWAWGTHAICEYGINDINAADTLSNIQSNYIRLWQRMAIRGLKITQTTMVPLSSSTDSWATTANQTPTSAAPLRNQVNAWLYDGAPVSFTANANELFQLNAVAVGTVGALRIGQPGHPVSNLFDLAAAVETTRGSNIWKANMSVGGLHPNPAGNAAIAAALPLAQFKP